MADTWKPQYMVCDYFEKFKRLKDNYEMTNWERVNHNLFYLNYFLQSRLNLCERTYYKEKNLPTGHNMVCRNLVGREFHDNPNRERSINEAVKGLTKEGKKMLTTFIETNKQVEKDLITNENNFFSYMHSKPPLELNKWKFSNHIIKQFSVPELDKIYSFRIDKRPKPKYMTKPFRRPKIDGDYFDKNIGILGN